MSFKVRQLRCSGGTIKPVLFSPPAMPAWWAIHFADVFSYFFIYIFLVVDLGATSFQELLDGSSPTFHGLVKLSKGFINFAFVWQSLKGRCHGHQLKSEN